MTASRSPEELRADALRQVQTRPDTTVELEGTDALVHELRVHQVELEMQNAELREAQALLEASRARYADLYDFAPVAYLTFDARGCVSQINICGAEMIGHAREDVVGKPFASIVELENPAAFFGHLKECRGRTERVTTELRFARRRDGVAFVVNVVSQARQDEGAVVASSALVDVTEQVRMYEERAALEREQAARTGVEHANRLKDEFLSVASHELRTPLSAILAWANRISQMTDLPADVGRGAEVILRNANAQLRLIDDVLDVSRLERGALPLRLTDVALAPVIAAAVETIEPAATAKQIRLSVLAPEDLHVWGDAARLHQVLWNLLTNAVKFTPTNGHVKVSLALAGDRVALRVADTGCGIAREHLASIFDRFRQVSTGTNRHHGGLGLGLTIVKQLVLEHGGEVVAQSGGPGTGTTMTVTLTPFTVERPPQLEGDEHRGVQAAAFARSLKGVRLLLVDDDADSLQIAGEILEGAGAVVAYASNAADAFEALLRLPPDCIVSDLGMPDVDGFAFLRRVRSGQHPFSNVPAIALTAYGRPADRKASADAGFNRHVSKPFQVEVLIEAIVSALAESRRASTS